MKYQNNGMSLARCMHCFNFVARLIYTRSSIYCEPLVSHVLRLRSNQIVGTSKLQVPPKQTDYYQPSDHQTIFLCGQARIQITQPQISIPNWMVVGLATKKMKKALQLLEWFGIIILGLCSSQLARDWKSCFLCCFMFFH